MINELIKAANNLDSLGFSKEANTLDFLIKKIASVGLNISEVEIIDESYYDYNNCSVEPGTKFNITGSYDNNNFQLSWKNSSVGWSELTPSRGSYVVRHIADMITGWAAKNNISIDVSSDIFLDNVYDLISYFEFTFRAASEEKREAEKKMYQACDEKDLLAKTISGEQLLAVLRSHFDSSNRFTLSKDEIAQFVKDGVISLSDADLNSLNIR